MALLGKKCNGGTTRKKVLAGVLTATLVVGNLALPTTISIGEVDFGALFAQAAETVDSGTCGENLTWVLDEDGVLTISGNGEMDDYKSGGAPWYRYSSSIIDGNIGGIKTIVIENGVTSIGEYAFQYCQELTSVEIPSSVTDIGEYAFQWCWLIENIAIPEGVSVICEGTFESCMSLRCVEIPVSVTKIEQNAFWACKILTFVYYWGSEDEWNQIEIEEDDDGTKNRILDTRIYYNFDEDMRIALSEYSGTCGENLTWVLDDGVLTISGSGDMEDYDSSEDIPWHDYINHIRTVVIEDGVTNIAAEAFYGSTTLTSVKIPDSVTSIGDSAFGDCSSLSSVYYSSEDDWNEIDIGEGNDCLEAATFYFDKMSKRIGTCGENLTWVLDDGVLTISGSGEMDDFKYTDTAPWYEYWEDIESIVIEDDVTSIGNYSFYGCSNVTSVEISDSVTNIGYCAFSNCTKLPSINIPDSVTGIENHAFFWCRSLISIEIPDSVISIGSAAFYGCSGLTSIEISDSVTTIGSQAFSGCEGLADEDGFVIIKGILFGCYGDNTNVVIPSGVTEIDDTAFYDCSSLASVEMPDSVTTIGSMAFADCTSLTSINIPDSVTYIGDQAFYGCEGLADEDGFVIVKDILFDYYGDNTSVDIPSGVTRIGDEAFYDCSDLTSVKIPNSVTCIGDQAFYGCEGLADEDGFVIVKDILFNYYGDNTSVDIPSGVTSIGQRAFYGCSSLISVDIPVSVTSIGYNAFGGCEDLLDVCYAGSESEWNKIDNNATFSESTTIYFTESSYEDGDANLDGSVDYLDAMTVLRADAELIELTDEQISVGDVNGDGSVDSLDAILILRYDAGLIESF